MKDFLAIISIFGFIAVSVLCLLAAKFGQEWFDDKIAETVAMLPDVNKSLLVGSTHDEVVVEMRSIDEEGSSSLE